MYTSCRDQGSTLMLDVRLTGTSEKNSRTSKTLAVLVRLDKWFLGHSVGKVDSKYHIKQECTLLLSMILFIYEIQRTDPLIVSQSKTEAVRNVESLRTATLVDLNTRYKGLTFCSGNDLQDLSDTKDWPSVLAITFRTYEIQRTDPLIWQWPSEFTRYKRLTYWSGNDLQDLRYKGMTFWSGKDP